MSRADAWMPLYIGDYLADTMHLSAVEHGAYLLLLMQQWRSGPLPDDDRHLAAIARVDPAAWKRHVGPTVRRFFEVTDEGLVQKRLESERQKATAIIEKRASAGKKGAARRWQGDRPDDSDDGGTTNGGEMANAMANATAVPMASASQIDGQSQSQSQSQESSSLRSDDSHSPPEVLREDSVSHPENLLPRATSEKSEDRPLALSPRPRTRREPDMRGFDEFWKLYPRKVGKGQAERAWPQALRATGGDADEIVWGLKAQLHKFDRREDCRFVAHPSTWLNGKRWLDGLDPEEPAAPSLLPDQPRSH